MPPGQTPNPTQADLWNTRSGETWVALAPLLDRMLQPFLRPLLDAVAAHGAHDVLDIGCGAGATTLAAARALEGRGRCLGADVSTPLVEAARRRVAEARVDNAAFVLADAQRFAFEPEAFDLMISRFGVMFFDDPVAAFANLRRAARPSAGLALIAWRGPADNTFMTTAEQAAASLLPPSPPPVANAPGQFAFADADRVRGILEASGWRDIAIRALDVPCVLPEDDLLTYTTRLGPIGMKLPDLDAETRQKVIAALGEAFAPYVTDGVARFDAACWLIEARNG